MFFSDSTFTDIFAWTNLLYNLACFCINITVHYYLLNMIIRIQALFRKFGSIKGPTGLLVAMLTYLLYSGYLIYWHLLGPY
jgi:hypothetical protein